MYLGNDWRLHYILKGKKPFTFEELATRAHDMKLTIATTGKQDFTMTDPQKSKDKKDVHKGEKE